MNFHNYKICNVPELKLTLVILIFLFIYPPFTIAQDQENTFTYRTQSEILSLDPHFIQDTTSSAISKDLFEGLLNQNEYGELVPGVATEFKTSKDKTVFQFTLREDAKWSDGSQVTAHDFVYSWRRAVDPVTESPYSWYFESMGILNAGRIISGKLPPSELGAKALDELLLEVTLEQSKSYFPAMITHTTLFPVHQKSIEIHGNDWTESSLLVSNGAYILTEFAPKEILVMSRNPNYWDNQNTKLENVVVKVIRDSEVALETYFDGKLDIVEIPPGRYNEFQSSHPNETHSTPILCTSYYVFNLSESGPSEFKSSSVRKALSHAVDREYITENVLDSGHKPVFTLTPDATAGFTSPSVPIMELTQEERNQKAMELLEESGFGPNNPLEFTILVNDSESSILLAENLSRTWESKLRAKVAIESVAWGEFLDRLTSREFEISRAGWCGDYNEASTFLDLVTKRSTYNFGNYHNDEVEILINKARKSDSPGELYGEIELFIERDVPIIPLFNHTDTFLLNPRVKNWPFGNIEGNRYSHNLYKVDD